MENTKPIDDELSVAMGQPTIEQLQQAATEGFKSVLNLRWHSLPEVIAPRRGFCQ
ncbi:hypothetical protein [Chamaesiphon minutus]|uniref:hypothetical protein n=1 Tax=Chamaesiphon minutus TaxID=1173032 RepID=UPI001E43E846